MSAEIKTIPTIEDFKTAAEKSIPEAAAIFVHYARGLTSPIEITRVERYRQAELDIQPSTKSEQAAVTLAKRELGFEI